MASLPDRASFEGGVLDAGQVACNYSQTGKSRADFQSMFRSGMTSSAKGSSLPDSVIDSMSVVIWSSAVTNLCPEGAPSNPGIKIPIPTWGFVVGAIVGLPIALWLLSALIGLVRALFTKPSSRREVSEFIAAWERVTLTSVTRLTAPERQAVRSLMARWRAEKRSGNPVSASAFIQRSLAGSDEG